MKVCCRDFVGNVLICVDVCVPVRVYGCVVCVCLCVCCVCVCMHACVCFVEWLSSLVAMVMGLASRMIMWRGNILWFVLSQDLIDQQIFLTQRQQVHVARTCMCMPDNFVPVSVRDPYISPCVMCLRIDCLCFPLSHVLHSTLEIYFHSNRCLYMVIKMSCTL